jgi:hypothetical protein
MYGSLEPRNSSSDIDFVKSADGEAAASFKGIGYASEDSYETICRRRITLGNGH